SDRRHELVEVTDQAVVGLLEDRGVRVSVDRDDDLRPGHTHHVLQLAGDADGEVQPGGDARAGTADVTVLAHPVQALGHRTGAGDLGVGGAGKLLDEGEVLPGLQAAADADHPVGGAEVRLVEAVRPGLDHLQAQRRGGDLFDGRTGAISRRHRAAVQQQSHRAGNGDGLFGDVTEDRVDHDNVVTVEGDRAGSGQDGRLEPSGDGAEEHPLPGIAAGEHDAGRVGGDGVRHRGGAGLGRHVVRRAAPDYLVQAGPGHGVSHRTGSGHHGPDRAAQGTRDCDEVADFSLVPDDDPGTHAHCLVLPYSVPAWRSAETSSAAALAGSAVSMSWPLRDLRSGTAWPVTVMTAFRWGPFRAASSRSSTGFLPAARRSFVPGTRGAAASAEAASTAGPEISSSCTPPGIARSTRNAPAWPVIEVTSATAGQPSSPASTVGTILAATSTDESPVTTRSTSPMCRITSASTAASSDRPASARDTSSTITTRSRPRPRAALEASGAATPLPPTVAPIS